MKYFGVREKKIFKSFAITDFHIFEERKKSKSFAITDFCIFEERKKNQNLLKNATSLFLFQKLNYFVLFLAAMSSSRSDDVTKFVCPSVSSKKIKNLKTPDNA